MTPRLTAPEVAEILRCSYTSARRLMASGQIEAVKATGQWTCTKEDVDAYLAAHSNTQTRQRRRRRRAS